MVAAVAQSSRCWSTLGGDKVKILMFGQSGQVAREVLRHAGPHQVMSLNRTDADLERPDDCARTILESGADLVLNAAAYTAVDRAESEPDLANLINAAAPAAMAQAARQRSLPFIHVSTDYVFNGSGHDPWPADAECAPLGSYGKSKLAGEDGIRIAHPSAIILRTSWVFSAHGNNFVKTMLRLGKERASLRVVDDQFGGPTAAADIAKTLIRLAECAVASPGTGGAYHYSGRPDVSWHDFAKEIFAQSGMATKVIGISTKEYPAPARRPQNSRLDCSRIFTDFGINRPDWKPGLAAVLRELGELI